MKVVSFFSAKGGTCKTTMNMLFASFLKYHLGKSVTVLDFDGPEYNLSQTRKRELLFAERNGIAVDQDALYPILEVDKQTALSTSAVMDLFDDLNGTCEFLVLDFGGSFESGDPVCRLVRRKAIDLLVIPVEMDGMIIASAKSLAWILKEQEQECLLFFNKVHGKENPQLYDKLEEWFRSKDVKLSRNRVKNTLKARRDSDNGANFIRSSVTFPLKEIRANNPGIFGLFMEAAGYEGMEKTEETA